jgi:hypothetical protein
MSCQNDEKCCGCCKIADLTSLEKQVLDLKLSLNAIFSEDSAVKIVELTDPVSARMYIMLSDVEDRIMKKLREIDGQLLSISVEQWKAEVR